jgi:hypothetical protein
MKKRTSFANETARAQRAAQSDLASLQRAMRSAEDTLAGLSRAIKLPRLATRRHVIKGSSSAPPLIFSALGQVIGGYLSYSIASNADLSSGNGSADGGGYFSSTSFYRSAGQIASSLTQSAMRGQRIL